MLKSTWIGLLAGIIGTGLGGLIANFVNCHNRRVLGFSLSGSAGVMTSISLIELIPEAISIGQKQVAAIGLVSGAAFLLLLDLLLPHRHWETSDTLEDVRHRQKGASRKGEKDIRGEDLEGPKRHQRRHQQGRGHLRSVGILIAIGIALHNVPEGLAIGSSFTHAASFGFGVAVLIALHNIPEGMAVAIPLRADGVRPLRVFTATLAAGAPTGLGAAIGALVGNISDTVLAGSLAFAAGAMMYVVADELLPEAHEYGEGHDSAFGLVAGILIGALIGFVAH